jgi:hypothetical protein
MKIAIQIFLLIFALWCSHLAGMMYLKAKDDPSIRFAAILRSALAAFAAAMVIVI